MKKYYFLIFAILFANKIQAQNFEIKGYVKDSLIDIPLKNALVTIIKIQDSTLVAFKRTDSTGFFEIQNLPIDTYQVLIEHPRFGDFNSYFFAAIDNYLFDLGRIILPNKSKELQEIVIYAYKEPVYYNGDTLVYDATKFKTLPNANVEDLLKKLPGIEVDANGKIKSQGKEIAKVLVDGDEFFGTDPTMATKNLAANAVESVQVYEQKKEDGDASSDETEQIMNIKLKEDAKKGYFGKVSAGSDFMKFGEGSLLGNYYNKSRKLSLYALASNTPNSSFDWNDIYTYGLNNEMGTFESDDGDYTMYTMDNSQNLGLPRLLKTGLYYSDKIGKKMNYNFYYNYQTKNSLQNLQRNTQFLLADTTYYNQYQEKSETDQNSHSVGGGVEIDLDSLTTLNVSGSMLWNEKQNTSESNQDFLNESNAKTRNTIIQSQQDNQSYDHSVRLKLKKDFKKEKRNLTVKASANFKNGIQNTEFTNKDLDYYNLVNTGFLQIRENHNNTISSQVSASFTEPFGKFFKWENGASLDYLFNTSSIRAKQNDIQNGVFAPLLYNVFETENSKAQASTKWIYESKKRTITAQLKYRNTQITNTNILDKTVLNQKYNQVFPSFRFNYKFTQNSSFNTTYNADSRVPSISQLQPVIDNTNPNNIFTGNLNLIPNYSHKINLRYNTWKPISGRYLWSNVGATITQNAFSNSIFYTDEGRRNSMPINIDYAQSYFGYIGGQTKIPKTKFSLGASFNYNNNQQYSIINQQKNVLRNQKIGQNYTLDFEKDSIEIGVSYGLDLNLPYASLFGENKPFNTQTFGCNIALKLPFKFGFKSDFQFIKQSERTFGIQRNVPLLGASITKYFFKKNQLQLSAEAHDIFNQNINFTRTVNDVTISDEVNNMITRFFLLKVTYNFTSNKTEETNDEMF